MGGHGNGPGSGAGDLGQSLVFTVVFVAVLFAFAAVVIDGGSFLHTRRNLQGDADQAALAAAQELPASTTLATAAARDYAETENDSGASLDSIDFASASTRANVVVARVTPGHFAAFFGMSAPTIRARASAQINQVTQVNGVLPFAALAGAISLAGQPPAQLEIKVTAGSAQNGNFGAVAPLHTPPHCDGNPSGASGHRDEIVADYGTGGLVACGAEVGETMDTKTGNMVGPTEDGFDRRFGSSDGTHPDRFADVVHWEAGAGAYVVDKPSSPRIGFIPVVTTTSGASQWPSGSSSPMLVVDYVMVYIGKIGEAGEPAYTTGPGNQIRVWVTPLRGRMPNERFDYEVGDDWHADSTAPTAIRLVD